MDVSTISKSVILIRLTDERWKHIALMHPALIKKKRQILNAVKNPDYILRGSAHELLAVAGPLKQRFLVVVYKETLEDGFIITAFETTDKTWLFNKEIIWSRPL